MRQAGLATTLGQQLQAGVAEARARSDELFRIVRPEALYDRPIPERHRIIFYLGHLEAFDWNLICRGAFEMESFHPQFDKLFAFGIDPVDGGRPSDQPSDWPRVEEILRYNERIQKSVDDCLRVVSSGSPRQDRDGNSELMRRFHVAIEHRLMHAETLAYMLHQLPLDRKVAGPKSQSGPPRNPQSRRVAETSSLSASVEIPAGQATLGLERSSGEFGWDNEFEQHKVEVPAFVMDVHNVTNGQFLQFLRASGYSERSVWTDADWKWITRHGITHPVFWKKTREEWGYRTMFEEIPLPLDWPVYVSHAEASAFARWLGKALPAEAQFHRAAYGLPAGGVAGLPAGGVAGTPAGAGEERKYPWGNAAPDARRGNFGFASWDPAPVGSFPDGDSAFGVADLLGNGWEWTSTVFAPFASFEAFPFYRGYSADFFDGQHYVIKGGSARTAERLLRRSLRNWFQPHYQYVYAAFRCVEN